MSNRFIERITTIGGGSGGTIDVNVSQEAGVPVAPPIGPGDNVPLPEVPFFSVGSVLYAWDGVNFQRLRVDGEKVLLTHEAYFRAGENPYPEAPSSTLSDALRTKRGETTRAVHLARQRLPYYDDGDGDVAIFTSQAAYPMLPGTARVTFWVTYYPSPSAEAVDGFVILNPYWGNGTDEMPDTACDPGQFPGPSPNVAALTLYKSQFSVNPVGASKDPVQLVVSMDVPAGATTCRMLAREGGAFALNDLFGDIQIAITTSS